MSRLPTLKDKGPWWTRLRQAAIKPRSVMWTFTPYKWGITMVGLLICVIFIRYMGITEDEVATKQSGQRPDLSEGIRLLEAERFGEAQTWFSQKHRQAPLEPASTRRRPALV